MSVFHFLPIFDEKLDFMPIHANKNNKKISKTLKNINSQLNSITHSPHFIRKLKLNRFFLLFYTFVINFGQILGFTQI